MAGNHTNNYHLNQWEPEDKVLREEFNGDNRKIDAALAHKLGRLEVIQEIVQEGYFGSPSSTFTVELGGIDWSEWELLAAVLLCRASGTDSESFVFLDLNGLTCYGGLQSAMGKRSPGNLAVVFFPRHDAANPIRFLTLPCGEPITCDAAFQQLERIRFHYHGSGRAENGAKIVLVGLR